MIRKAGDPNTLNEALFGKPLEGDFGEPAFPLYDALLRARENAREKDWPGDVKRIQDHIDACFPEKPKPTPHPDITDGIVLSGYPKDVQRWALMAGRQLSLRVSHSKWNACVIAEAIMADRSALSPEAPASMKEE